MNYFAALQNEFIIHIIHFKNIINKSSYIEYKYLTIELWSI